MSHCSQQMCGNTHLHKNPELEFLVQIFSTSDHTVLLVHRAAQSYFLLWIACLSLGPWRLIGVRMEIFTTAPMKDAGILTSELQNTAGLRVHTVSTRQQWHDRLMPTLLSCTLPRAQAIKHRGHLQYCKTFRL